MWGIQSPIWQKKRVIHALASLTFVDSIQFTGFLWNLIAPSLNLSWSCLYCFCETFRTEVKASQQRSLPSIMPINSPSEEVFVPPVIWKGSRRNWFCSVILLEENLSLDRVTSIKCLNMSFYNMRCLKDHCCVLKMIEETSCCNTFALNAVWCGMINGRIH